VSDRDPLWYKDAVFYELHVRAFKDGNDDGIGDFIGLTSQLGHLKELGVDCLWLLPFFRSPLRDDGYDVADYRAIHPDYGTMADFDRFLEAAHGHGMRVISDLVVNHTSDQHPWFQRARRAAPGDAVGDFRAVRAAARAEALAVVAVNFCLPRPQRAGEAQQVAHGLGRWNIVGYLDAEPVLELEQQLEQEQRIDLEFLERRLGRHSRRVDLFALVQKVAQKF